MLDDTLKSQLAAYLERITLPIKVVASLGDDSNSVEMRELPETIQTLRSDRITVRFDGTDARVPSFSLKRAGTDTSLRFAGLPLGHEFTSLVQALALMAIFNPKVKTTVIEGGAFQAEVTDREIMAVPSIYLNGALFGNGGMLVEEIIAKLDTGASAKDAAKLSAKDPYDVLIIGGGPASAAAAFYAARKGIRTGLAAERFGGQTNDTMAIENYISVIETDGPKFAAALEAEVRQYGVDIMNLQEASKIIPATEPGGLVEVQMANGGSVKSKTIIVPTGARWRNVNVPGEAEYKNKGVAYCPHGDGPLFKGKRTAVIGGGNSGI